MPSLFGTSGIRGEAETVFTNDFCVRLGLVFGTWLANHNKTGYVAVAMDPRESSPRIKRSVVAGLAAAGWEILDQGVVPTPALTYFTKETPSVGGGLMVSGSHVTANLNGVKLFIDGEEVDKAQEKEIEELFAQITTRQLPDKSQAPNPIIRHEDSASQLYLEMLKRLANTPYPGWKIVVDTANGCQTEIVRQLFSDLNLDTDCTGECDIQSPHFVPRDTETQSAFTDLIRQVLNNHADLGIGFDVDGDRVIFIDELGRYLPGDYSCSLIAAASPSPSIVTPINTASVVDRLGKRVYRTPVGSTYVVAKMKEVGSTFGFEANGGGISSEIFWGRDGGSTVIKLLNLMKSKNAQLSKLYDELPRYYLWREKVDCPSRLNDLIYSRVRQKYSQRPINDLDGLKIDLGRDEWILYRASGNAPEFRVFTQSPDAKKAQKLGQEGLSYVKSITQPVEVSGGEKLDSLHIMASIKAFPEQCAQVLAEIKTQTIPTQCSMVDNIVISGMGGSALGGRILASLDREALTVPLVVSSDYHLPNFVGPKTLVVVSSYSGDTEETLASLTEALDRKAQIFILTSGGKLGQIAQDLNLPAYIFSPQHNPSGQPRMALGYNIMTLVSLLASCGLISPPVNLEALPQFLADRQDTAQAQAKLLAEKLAGRIPVLMASEHLLGVSHDLKNQLNENAKTFAVAFDLPEANHHLLEGLTRPAILPQTLAFVFLPSAKYHPEVGRRYPITQRLVSKLHLPVFELVAVGQTPFFEAMDAVQTGAYLAFHLAGINGVDPGPIPWVDYFKDEIRQVV